MRNMKRLLALLLVALLICSNLPAALMEDNGLEIIYDDAPDTDVDFNIEDGGEESPDVDAPVAELDDFELTADDAEDDTSEFEDGFEAYDAFEEQVVLEEEVACPDVDFDSEAAAAQFIDRAMSANRQGRVSFRAAYGTAGKSKLTGADANLYNVLKQLIHQVAEGERSDTHFVIEVRDIFDKLTYTAEDLGLETLYGSDGNLTAEARDAINAVRKLDTNKVIAALLIDCPYDLYWYDKTVGVSWLPVGCNPNGETIQLCKSKNEVTDQIGPYFEFYVSKDYSVSGNTGTFEMDTDKASAVKSAAANAARIIEHYSGAADMDKLIGYKNAICDLVSYNNTAANTSGYPYGDPWQLVWVFDGDASTNVVCEGYSKAFQYLCDMSQFDEDISVISVQGNMSSSSGNSGLHMWNLVNRGGVNYLADITNCDSGSSGYPDKLFMKGYSYKDSSGNYCFETGSSRITYIFDESITNLFKAEDLDYTDLDGNHAWSNWTTTENATCTVAGSRKRTCDTCGKVETEEIPATGHSWGEWDVTKAAGCTEAGSKARTCATCELTETEVVPATGHSWGEWDVTKAAGCTEAGSKARTCATCELTETEVVPATGHSWGEWDITKDAGCTEAGSKEHTCATCKLTETEEIPATGHKAVAVKGYDATCTKEGLTEGSQCSVCKTWITPQKTIPKQDHTPVTVKGKAATCTATGLTDGTKCSVCGVALTAQKTIPKKDHTPVTVKGKAATCTATGLTDGTKCSACGTWIKAQQTIARKAHTPTTVKGYAATYVKAGLSDGSKCSVCGTTLTAQKTIARKTYPGSVLAKKGKNGTITVNLGEQFLLTPAFATSAGLTVKGYKSSKKKVAVVDGSGIVTAKAEGKTTITVTTNNKKKKATVVVKVVDPYKPTGVSITNGKKVTLEMGKTLKLGTKLKPDTAQSNLTFKSSKKSVATVDGSGLVKPVKEGTVKITVTTRNKKKATITVKVVDPFKPTGISITNGKTVTIKVGETLKLGTQLKPTTAQSELTWKSANKKIATVDATGTVKALKKGKVKITVTSKKNKKVKATITIKVEP